MCVGNTEQDNAPPIDGAKAHHRSENRVVASCDTGVNVCSAFGNMVEGILLSGGEEGRVGINVGGEVCAAGVGQGGRWRRMQ